MTSGWERTTVGSAFETVTGSTPPKSVAENYGTFISLVKPPELRDATLDRAADGLSAAGASAARTAPVNSILVSCIGNLGKVGLNTVPVAFNQQINAILPDYGKAIPKFMFYQALSDSFRDQLEALATGTTISIVNKSKFNGIAITIAPLAEQHRIVGILDEAFEGIATAKANAEQNLRHARALYASCLNSEIASCDQRWPGESIGSVCNTGAGGTPLKSRQEYYDGGTIPWILSGEVAQGEVRSAAHFITDAGLRNSSAKVFPQDTVLVAMYGATAGEVGLLKIEAATNQAVCGIFPSRAFLPEFLFFVLRSRKEALVAQAIGNAQPNISQAKIRSTLVPMVPRALQADIVSKLHSLSGTVGDLESIYERKIHALDVLKRSLLRKAFSGQL